MDGRKTGIAITVIEKEGKKYLVCDDGELAEIKPFKLEDITTGEGPDMSKVQCGIGTPII